MDVALWQDDPGNQPTGTVMIQWTAPNQNDSVYFGDNAFNNGKFGYNNLQQVVGTWTHKFNDKIYTATEAWYMYMNDAKSHPMPEVPFQSGSFPVRDGYASEWAILNYTLFRIAPAAFLTVRNEYMNDRSAVAPALPRNTPSTPSASPGGRTKSSPCGLSFASITLTMCWRSTTARDRTSSSFRLTSSFTSNDRYQH